VLVNIDVIKKDVPSQIALLGLDILKSSIIAQFESYIFRIGVISFFFHQEAIVEYAVANSKAVISQVQRAIGAQ